jgi:hypothetical protein
VPEVAEKADVTGREREGVSNKPAGTSSYYNKNIGRTKTSEELVKAQVL